MYDDTVKDNYKNQIKTDIDKHLVEHREDSNGRFVDVLYNFLQQKYDWRVWFVVAYKEMSGDDKDYGTECYGYNSFRRYGRNLRVASRDGDTIFDYASARLAIRNLKIQ